MIIGSLIALGYVGIFILVFAINLIPFASPSNLVLAGALVYFTNMHPAIVALTVAVSATLAKLSHFYLATYFGKRVNHKTPRLGRYSEILGRWGALGAFIAAASPIPDDPVVIPLGLMRFDALKFVTAYFIGKALITLLGAYGVRVVEVEIETLLGNEASIIGSAILSILAITVLLKMDPSRVREYLSRAQRFLQSRL